MNRRLLDPFQSVQLPEIIEEYLEHGTALCMAFNRRGTLLASGTKEGQVVIWDFDTRGVAALLHGHEGPVTSVSWSRNGRFLLSGSEDQRAILWNMDCKPEPHLPGRPQEVARVPLGSPVVRVSLSPRPPHLGVACLAEGPPVLIRFDDQQLEPLSVAGDNGDSAPSRGGGGGSGAAPLGGSLALFSQQGGTIISCQLRGALTVIDAGSRRILDIVRLPNSSRIVDLALNRKGTLLLATCQDQRVRMYEVVPPTRGSEAGLTDAQLAEALGNKSVKSGSLLYGDEGLLRPVREFQNAVERTPWRTATFSCDSEHVVGVSAAKAQHHIYVWNRLLGNMERILEGPKESALELAWHPISSMLLSCTASGRIYIWAKVQAENWSAFAPDFKELDENTEYVEREDEFDWNTPGARGDLAGGRTMDGNNAGDVQQPGGGAGSGEELDVLDILTREPYYPFSSDDEESVAQGLPYLDVVVEREPPPSAGADQRGGGSQGRDEALAGGPGAEGSGLQGQGQNQGYGTTAPHLQHHLGRMADFPRQMRRSHGPGQALGPGVNGSGEPGRSGRGGGRQGSVATDSGDAGAGSGAGGDATDMDEVGWGAGLGLQGGMVGGGVPMDAAAAATVVYQRQLQPQEQQLLQQSVLVQQQMLLQVLQQQQQQGLQGQGQGPALEWMAAAAAMQGALPAGAAPGAGGGQQLELPGVWAVGGAAAMGGDVDMREVADDMDEAGGGLPGRKRRVQFNDGSLDVRQGR